MSILQQIDVLPAGCQPWNFDVCAASEERFAYCSTLAIYVYQVSLDRYSRSIDIIHVFVNFLDVSYFLG